VNPTPEFWVSRCRAIVDHERHLAEQGTVILKFWLKHLEERAAQAPTRTHRRPRQELEIQPPAI